MPTTTIAFNVGVLIERIGSLSGSLVAVLAVAQPLTTACSGDRPTFGRPAPDAAAPIPSTDTDAATSTDSTTRTAPTTGSDAGLDTPTPDEGIDGAVGEEMTTSGIVMDASPAQTDTETVADTGADALQTTELGGACVESDECASGYCVEGVCCNDTCTGECQTCAAPESEGLCSSVQGEPPPAKADCMGDGLCRGFCDGISSECQYPGETTVCSVASCSDSTGSASAQAQCNGAGSRLSSDVLSCGNFACDGVTCRAQCQHDGHCREGAICFEGACVKYQQKQILVTSNGYGLGDGMAGADTYCQSQFGERGSTWKALMVGGGRTATVTPNAGDGQEDWVVHPYTEYYNWEGRLSWVTHDVALLGVRDGQRVDLLQPATEPYAYPWSGYADDWTTVSDQTFLAGPPLP